jgi:hypothetical protein
LCRADWPNKTATTGGSDNLKAALFIGGIAMKWKRSNIEDYPGSPWSVCRDDEPDREIIEVTCEEDAVMALVLAAPDLLEALENLLPIAEKYAMTSFSKDSIRIARAAIAKAEGGQHE